MAGGPAYRVLCEGCRNSFVIAENSEYALYLSPFALGTNYVTPFPSLGPAVIIAPHSSMPGTPDLVCQCTGADVPRPVLTKLSYSFLDLFDALMQQRKLGRALPNTRYESSFRCGTDGVS